MVKFIPKRGLSKACRAFRRKRGQALRRGLGLPRGAPLVHKFKEWTPAGTITCAAASVQGGIMAAAINQLTNQASIAALFDLYKITGIKFKIVPSWNVGLNTTMGPGGSSLPNIYVAPNHDPYVPAPTSISDILNDDGVRILRPTRPFSFYIKNPVPRVFLKDGQDVPYIANSGYGAKNRSWLTTGGNAQLVDQSNVPHYGLRWLIDNEYNASTSVEMKVFMCIYFMAKEQD